jgi:hypothetical protein
MYAERGGPDRFEPYLTGRHESENLLRGHKAPDPVMIGDPAKVALVMAAGSEAPKLQITRAGFRGLSLADLVQKKLAGPEQA